ncbi:RidA family protein [Desulfocurvus sp. DL9XJH121]
MSQTIVQTDKAPAAIGPYSQAVKAGNLVFVSGQIPVNPADGTIPQGIAAQTEQAMKNLAAVLEAAGGGLDDVLKTSVFIKDMGEFAVINEIYAKHMAGHAPARACVEVARLPKDVLVEVEAVALID